MLRKGATFWWMEGYNNTVKLLKFELVKMPTLQYPNPNKPFELFTDASKHSYSDILHQEETLKTPDAETNLIPIAYFSGSFGRTPAIMEYHAEGVVHDLPICPKMCFLSHRCQLYFIL